MDVKANECSVVGDEVSRWIDPGAGVGLFAVVPPTGQTDQTFYKKELASEKKGDLQLVLEHVRMDGIGW